MPRRSKDKGNAFERKIAKMLSRWLTAGEDQTQLISSKSSGGWTSKVEGPGGWRQTGDIADNGPKGEEFRRRFGIECKHHKEIQWWHVFTQKPRENLHGWWLGIHAECEPYPDLIPMLVVKMNHRPIMFGIPESEWLFMDLDDEMDPYISFRFGEHRVVFGQLKQLIKIPPARILQ